MRRPEIQPIRDALVSPEELASLDRAAKLVEVIYQHHGNNAVYQDEDKFLILSRVDDGLLTVFTETLTVVDCPLRRIWQYRMYRHISPPHTPQYVQLFSRTGNEEEPWASTDHNPGFHAANMSTYLLQMEKDTEVNHDDLIHSYHGIVLMLAAHTRLNTAEESL